MTVLIVDDSSSSLSLLAQMVQRLGRTPRCFTDPLKALELAAAATQSIELAVVDYNMPEMDGISLVRRLKAMPAHADLPLVMITANEDKQVRYAALEAGAADFLRKPVDEIELHARLRNLLSLRQTQRELKQHLDTLAERIAAATRTLVSREEEIILRLSRAAEFRDTETGAHIQRMSSYCRIIADKMGVGAERARMIYLAAPMHDVGKMAISDAILRKQAALSPEERKDMERHTVQGHSILAGSTCELLQLGAEIALNHHERWDGRGYPNGLAGEAIPLSARIAAVADVFDALTSERSYKRAWPPAEARAYIAEAAGTHFDPQCVAAFFAGWEGIMAIYQSDRGKHAQASRPLALAS